VNPPRPGTLELPRALPGSGHRDWQTPLREWLTRLWLPLLALAVWEIVTRFHWLDPMFFPSPSRVVEACRQALRSGDLGRHFGATCLRLAGAYLAGNAAGIVAGLTLGGLPFWRRSVQPVFSGLFSTPKLALLPAFLILFGMNDFSRILPAALSCFILMATYSMDAARAVKPGYADLARCYRAGRWTLFRRVYLPACLPGIFTGLRLGLGHALVMVVAAEMLGSRTGLGAFIWISGQTLAMDRMYAGIAVCALLGIGASYVFERVERRLVPWAP
jgi:NitT/TauT family transport system permease protein